ncbi:DNA repair protein [Micromonospora sp. NBC_01655]|uniref:DNA repair protein n=1 Tax=unclassified Micromonospora TaxID=2617518 RepID=UPI000E448B95|nr:MULTISPECIES: DNA repair protein [unclassified Micromonospora]MCX4474068.1 DNA repair protein [Micromonospora sp. NBC_01655]
MPNLPDDRYQQDTERHWRGAGGGRFPTQPAYREVRDARHTEPALSWAELNRLPAGVSTRRGLTAR